MDGTRPPRQGHGVAGDTPRGEGVDGPAGARVIRFPSYAAGQLTGRSPAGRWGGAGRRPAGRSPAGQGLSLLVAVAALVILIGPSLMGGGNALATLVALVALFWVFIVRRPRFTGRPWWSWRRAPLERSRSRSRPWGRLGLIGLGLVLIVSDTAPTAGGALLAWAVVAHLREKMLQPGDQRQRHASGAPIGWGGDETQANPHRAEASREANGLAAGVDPHRRAAILAGITGEEAVVRLLSRELPGGPAGYVVFQNLSLPRTGGDIDHLVIGLTGLFVLETKNVAGFIECNGDGVWRRTKLGRRGTPYDARMDDPVAQLRRNVQSLRQYLERHDPELCARTRLWIAGMVVFPHPDAHLHVTGGDFPSLNLEHVVPAILGHRPRQPLSPADVARLVDLLTTAGAPGAPATPTPAPDRPPVATVPLAERGTAILETALVLPFLLALALGVVGVGRVVQAQMGVRAVAREAARAAALANSGVDADPLGRGQAAAVASGYGLRGSALQVDLEVGGFARGSTVRATVRYQVHLDDLPLLSWLSVPLSSTHVERVDRYRSRW